MDSRQENRMKAIINHLVQLQELYEARMQHETSLSRRRLRDLDQAIEDLLSRLPEDVARRVTRLQRKAPPAVVPVVGKACGGCGMNLPVSMLPQIKVADRIYTCPNCARILYALTPPYPRRLPRSRGSNLPSAGIARFSAPELMLPHIQAQDMEEAFREICSKMEAEGFVEGAEMLVEKAMQREAIASTAIGHGLAFPHVRGVEGGGLVLAVATSRKGVRFEDVRGLVRILFFIVIPSAASAFYLNLLSGLTRAFSESAARDQLLKAKDPSALWEALVHTTRSVVR
ncbi:MAG: hypothetical protein DRP22_00535 [Verrucomicrobia bacterium]|nr:MAG: hypothetical protein DRP22_00535 [Verrucomicrobiota bacterium]